MASDRAPARPAPYVMPPELAAIFTNPPARSSSIPTPPPAPKRESVTLTIDGHRVVVRAGSTLLDAARVAGTDVPTLCHAPNLTPVNVCRLCVVEVEGSRALAPACSRRAEDGLVVETENDRVRAARRGVLELLGSSVDLGLAGQVVPDASLARWSERYGADPSRFGPPAPPSPAGDRDARTPGHHHPPAGDGPAETVAQPVTIDNDLYVRDYARCVLCYKCVEACGSDAQNTFAIAVAGRGFDARISTEFAVPLPSSACVYCGNCIGVCPTGALMFRSEHDMRATGTWDETAQTVTETICAYCGVGCTLELHVQENRIVKVTSPADSSAGSGQLCIKGRFGFDFVQSRDR